MTFSGSYSPDIDRDTEPHLAILPVSKSRRCHLSQSSHSHEHGQFAESRRNFVNIAPLQFSEKVARLHYDYFVSFGANEATIFKVSKEPRPARRGEDYTDSTDKAQA